MTKILYIGKHPEILETVVRLLNANPDWEGVGAATNQEAMDLFQNRNFDLILLGCGLSETEEMELKTSFKQQKSDIQIIQHYGGGSGLLFSEIQSALNSN